ncbi:Alkaline ceramidase 3 [Kappamyces sp. JEL0829]|nr:Alkaline ceramidase 3 [Kappamyces sp. JEL0829]KAJ3368151.1 Alkaline ceramidase 3 [Kappamyces sp. JEL0680]
MILKFNLTRHLASDKHVPFWGPTSSTVDWCETNYEISPYVAEYFNSLSSFTLVLIGLLGMILHPWAERRFHMAFLAIIVVGLGSVAFHGTLQKASQALDEVPMLYTAFAFVYITLCQRFPMKQSKRHLLAMALISHAVITTYLVTAFEGYSQFVLFHVSFGTAEFFSIYQMVRIYRSHKGQRKLDSNRLFESGLAIYMFAFVFWLSDMVGCEYINPSYPTSVLPINPQFHAWWHFTVSAGLYTLAIYTLNHRMQTSFSNRQPKIAYFLNLIPFIQIVPMSKAVHKMRTRSMDKDANEETYLVGVPSYNTFQ